MLKDPTHVPTLPASKGTKNWFFEKTGRLRKSLGIPEFMATWDLGCPAGDGAHAVTVKDDPTNQQ